MRKPIGATPLVVQVYINNFEVEYINQNTPAIRKSQLMHDIDENGSSTTMGWKNPKGIEIHMFSLQRRLRLPLAFDSEEKEKSRAFVYEFCLPRENPRSTF